MGSGIILEKFSIIEGPFTNQHPTLVGVTPPHTTIDTHVKQNRLVSCCIPTWPPYASWKLQPIGLARIAAVHNRFGVQELYVSLCMWFECGIWVELTGLNDVEHG